MGRVKTAKELMIPRPRSLADMLAKFPGVYISGDSVILSGVKNYLFLLDDIPTTFEDVRNINIDEIEVIKDASVQGVSADGRIISLKREIARTVNR